MSLAVHTSFWVSVLNSLEKYLEVALLDCIVVLSLNFWGTSLLVSIVTVPVFIPTNTGWEFPFLYILTNTVCFLLDNSHSKSCSWWLVDTGGLFQVEDSHIFYLLIHIMWVLLSFPNLFHSSSYLLRKYVLWTRCVTGTIPGSLGTDQWIKRPDLNPHGTYIPVREAESWLNKPVNMYV